MSFPNLSAFAVRERALTLFFLILAVLAGAYAFVMLGRAEDPSFTIKNLTVTAAWPGATAREMQDLVELESSGGVLYANRRYGATYVVDRPSL